MAAKPKAVDKQQLNENLTQLGEDVRIERGPAPGDVDAISKNPKHEITWRFYVYQLVDEDPTDSQDGVWEEIGHYGSYEEAEAAAAKL
jgi:hypothetical protein